MDLLVDVIVKIYLLLNAEIFDLLSIIEVMSLYKKIKQIENIKENYNQ